MSNPYAEKMMTCPFDLNHVIRSSKFESHILKCKKNFREMLEVCPFNAKHTVTKGQMNYHLKECPDRIRMITEKQFDNQIDSYETHAEELDSASLKSRENQASSKMNAVNASQRSEFFEPSWDDEIVQVPVMQPRSEFTSRNNTHISYSYPFLSKKQRKDLQLQMIEDFKKTKPNAVNNENQPLNAKN